MKLTNLNDCISNKVLVSFSGGIDSTVLCYYYKDKGYKVTCAIFKPLGDSNGEYEDAVKVANSLNLDYIEVGCCNYDLLKTKIRINNPNSEMIESTNEVDFLVGWKMNMALQLLSIGAAYNYDKVVFGHNVWNNHFKDETLESFKKYEQLFRDIYGDRVKIPSLENPFYDLNLDDSGIVKLGSTLSVPFIYTMSCAYNVYWLNAKDVNCKNYKLDKEYFNNDVNDRCIPIHCGNCYFCKARKQRFIDACVNDPTIYFER